MKHRTLGQAVVASSLMLILAGCSFSPSIMGTPQGTPTVKSTPIPLPTFALSAAATATSSTPLDSVTDGVTASGEVKAAQDADLSFQVPGIVNVVNAREGDTVKKDDALAVLDLRSFDQQVTSAQANLKTAQARLDQAKGGHATEEQIAAQAAAVRSSEAALNRARTGGITGNDIANAAAGVRAAEANVQKAKTGGVRPQDIANAEAAVRGAEAQVELAKTGGVRAQDITSAEAALRASEAQLEQAARGAPAEQVSAAQTALDQARQNREKIAAADSAAKSSGFQTVQQAADDVRKAQQAYSTAYWNNDQAQNGVDPTTGKRFSDEKLDPDIQKQKYADALTQATLTLNQAQAALQQANIAYDNIKQQEINDIANADSQVKNAQVQLEELQKGPDPVELAPLQAQVDQARAALEKLQAGGTPASIQAAQAGLDQARAQLEKLRAGGTASDVQAAQAGLDQAHAQLAKLKAGGTASDVASAQAQVDAAQAQLDGLSSPSAPSDISIAEAGVETAQAQLAQAELDRDRATLHAPFDGIIDSSNVDPGDNASAASNNGVAFRLVDPSKLHIDVGVSESDVSRVRVGQTAQILADALDGQEIVGKVTYIAPAATVSGNIRTYLVRVVPDDGNAPLRVGMSVTVVIKTSDK